MKNTIITLMGILILLPLFALPQTRVIEYEHFSIPEGILVFPDVEGKALIIESFYVDITQNQMLTPFVLYPDWPVEYTGSSQRGGVYCNLDEDDDLEIVYNVTQQVYAWNIDGSVVDGWPVSVSLYPDGAPAFGDIDGDGEGEIVVSSRAAGTGNTGSLKAFHLDGSVVAGFPVSLTGGATKTPVLADLNGDGVLEVIVEERDYPDGYVGVYYGNGTPYPGFPVMLDYIPGSAVAVGDITGDNIPEIVAESYYSIFAYDVNGNVLEGFPFTPGNERVFSYSTPVLADLDGDGLREIIAGDHSLSAGNGAVHVLKNDGTPLSGWPKYTGYWIYGPPAVGDIDGDGNLDVTVGDQVLSGSPVSRVFAWDKDGNNLPGWPTDPIWAINNQIILADLDGDNMVELMWDDNTSGNIYLGYNHDGTPMEGWPLSLSGSSFFMNPFVTDINNDGVFDVSGASGNLSTNALHFYLWNANVPVNNEKSPLTILQYNVRHDGTYVDVSVLNANFNASPVEVCEGGQVQFNDISTGEVISWDWAFEGGDPATSTEQNPLVTYSTTGEYDVSLTVSDGSSTNTSNISDYIKVAYEAVVPDQPLGPDNFSTDTANFTYYETWSLNADEYIWELVPEDVGVIIAGDTITQVKIYWSTDENYSAELKVKAVNVCGESDFSEPLTIYVNWTVGKDKHETESFAIYPNPSKGEFIMNVKPEGSIQSYQLYNSSGKMIRSSENIKNKKQIFVQNLNPGLYYIHLLTANGKCIEKVVVH